MSTAKTVKRIPVGALVTHRDAASPKPVGKITRRLKPAVGVAHMVEVEWKGGVTKATPEGHLTPVACRANVASGSWYTMDCGRVCMGVLKNGKPACARHLTVERKRAEKMAAHSKNMQASDALRGIAEGYCERLRVMGFDAHPHFDMRERRHTGGVVITDPDILLRALED